MTADIVRYSVALKGKKVRSQTNPDIIFHSNSCLGQIRSCFFHAKLYRVNPVLLKKSHAAGKDSCTKKMGDLKLLV